MTASRSVSTLSSYIASGAKGSSEVGPSGFTLTDGCMSMMRMDLLESSGLGKANRSQKSRRASSCGWVKSGPEEWCDIVAPPCLLTLHCHNAGSQDTGSERRMPL